MYAIKVNLLFICSVVHYSTHVCQMNSYMYCKWLIDYLFFLFLLKCSCLNQCTYCKTKHARGDLGSYPPEEIVARAKQAFEGKPVVESFNNS